MIRFYTYPKDYYSNILFSSWEYWLINTHIFKKHRALILRTLENLSSARQSIIIDHHFKSLKALQNFYKNLHIANVLKPFFRQIYIVCPDYPDMAFEYRLRTPWYNIDKTIEYYHICSKYRNILPVIQFNFTVGRENIEQQLIRQLDIYKEKYLGIGSVCKFVSNTKHYKLFNKILYLLKEHASEKKFHYFGLSLSILKKFIQKMIRYDLIYSFDSNAYTVNSKTDLITYATKIYKILGKTTYR